VTAEKRQLLEEYEARGDEATYPRAKRLYEEALAETPDDPRLLHEFGYLQECHGRVALRVAASQYEHAIELAPDWEKPRYQLLQARAALFESHNTIAVYRKRLATAPDDIREYRYLARAYLLAGDHREAERVIADGLGLAPDDARLVEMQGEVDAVTGRVEDALSHWRRALALDRGQISAHYLSAFLLEREGRLDGAIAKWRAIIDWSVARGYTLDAEWPRRELERLTKPGLAS
jgi:tetratricopeptide (TPR) repeat protein